MKNYDDRYKVSTRPAKPIRENGHEFWSQGAGQYRCSKCNLQVFLPAAQVPACTRKEEQPQ